MFFFVVGLLLALGGLGWTWWVARKQKQQDTSQQQLIELQQHIQALGADNLRLREVLQGAETRLRSTDDQVGVLRGHESGLRDNATVITERFLEEAESNAVESVNEKNLDRVQARLAKVWAFVEKHNFQITSARRSSAQRAVERAYRLALEHYEDKKLQSHMKEEMREKAREDRDRQQALAREERETKLIEDALARALLERDGQHGDEIAALRQQLSEAQARLERTKSMAQLTRAGHVYVISNAGAFGDDIYKIGMTRREEPQDRVDELGDASVPFPFDIHMLIYCDDAPKLEHTLHTELAQNRMNLVNLRKEFFQVPFDVIRSTVERLGGTVKYEIRQSTLEAQAFEYNESERLRKEGRASDIPVQSGAEDE